MEPKTREVYYICHQFLLNRAFSPLTLTGINFPAPSFLRCLLLTTVTKSFLLTFFGGWASSRFLLTLWGYVITYIFLHQNYTTTAGFLNLGRVTALGSSYWATKGMEVISPGMYACSHALGKYLRNSVQSSKWDANHNLTISYRLWH